MSKGVIMLSGGGGSGLPAIHVRYPEGSVCTCSNGTKSCTAKDTSGVWLFAGLDYGDWTVSAAKGTSTKSAAVTLSAEAPFASVELSYEYVLFDAANGGLIVPWKAGELSGDASTTISDSVLSASNGGSNSRAHIITAAKIDITGYSVLKFNITVAGGGTNAIGTCTGIDPFSKYGVNNTAVHYVSPPTVGENSVPLTSDGSAAASGEYYIFLSANGNASRTISADRVWLE